MNETMRLLNKLNKDKEWIEDLSAFEFYSSSLKQLAAKIRTECSRPKLKNYYL